MSIESYVVGQPVRFKARFTDETGTPVDPSQVTLFINPPTEPEFFLTLADNEITNDEGMGNFSAIWIVNEDGDWNYRWETVSPVCVAQGIIQVRERTTA